MKHFLHNVNHARILFFFGNIGEEYFSDSLMIKVTEGKVDEWSEHSMGMNAENVLEWILIKDPKRMNIFKSKETAPNHYAFSSNNEFYVLRILGKEEIAYDTDEDESNSHEGTIGVEGVGDHSK